MSRLHATDRPLAVADETSSASLRAGRGRGEELTTGYARSPQDLLRLLVLGASTVVLVALTRWAERSVLGFESDLIDMVSGLPSAVERIVAGSVTLVAAIALLTTVVVPLATRRFRLLGYILLSNVVCALLYAALVWWLDRGDPLVLTNELSQRAGLDANAVVDVEVLVQLAGALAVATPFVSHAWRRSGTVILGVLVLARVIVSVDLPATVFAGVLLGSTVGSAVLVAFGRPARRPTDRAIQVALADAGLDITSIDRASVDARGSVPYFAEASDGTGLFVKVLGEDERAADLLFRAYRFVRLRNVGDERPFSSLRRAVEHEALLALAARDLGIRTPRLRAVVDVGADSMLLAYERIGGRSLDSFSPAEVTDDLMRSTWALVGELHRHRIAHRDLRRANVFVSDAGEPWIIDFGFSELAASDGTLAGDIAQLLASFAVVAGPGRTAAVAVEVLGPDAVAGALPRLQLPALSGATQAALKQQHGLLGELQTAVAEACDTEEVEYERLARVSGRSVATAVLIALATYFLLPQLADLPGIVDQIREANWWWVLPMLVASAATYLGATIAMLGAVPERLPVGPTAAAQTASSFASKLAPAGLGGMALNVRFLQKQGVDPAVAVSSVGLNTGAGAVGHVGLLVVFVLWAGRDAFESFRLPDATAFLLVALGLLLLGALSMVIPYSRHLVIRKLWPVLRRGVDGIVVVLRRPAKVVALIGGSVLVTGSYLVGAYLGVEAFGGTLAFATVGACYLVGSAVATAVPAPGGLGAMEVALIASLTAAGLDKDIAVPAVFLFRFTTFWLPILPGWAAFSYLRRSDRL